MRDVVGRPTPQDDDNEGGVRRITDTTDLGGSYEGDRNAMDKNTRTGERNICIVSLRKCNGRVVQSLVYDYPLLI